ncbi:phosphate ABC transporter permease PstA [Methanocalculus taiwanensis]|uniref:Phosphate ABC transporter permease PstA n=1 Tax=Methanocalculus taiwanensis TaxID=106207 RepID=A0ABD4TF46_9EURY|nr:phosphate ABC transporter permease PstA [Methanocalculus taiwanensis]MCQ1537628.1 phosphate ABC transporter permease PstA [Methanocalculus taiwanensis]
MQKNRCESQITDLFTRQNKEKAISGIWLGTALVAVITIILILGFLLKEGLPAILEIGIPAFIFNEIWTPTSETPSYGIYSLIIGTILVTIGAIAIAVPLGIGSAIFIAEVAPPKFREAVKPAIELLAGIPSVVYGFFGLVVLTHWLRISLDLSSGATWLAGSIILGIMALPTIVSVSEDAISSVPKDFRSASLALGATRWQTITGVLIPSALSGITAAIILGLGRAIGETMAVLMVTGNAAIIPDPIYNILSPIRTLTATLGIEMGEVAIGSTHYHALFGMALVLLLITLIVNLSATVILARIREGQIGSSRAPFLSHDHQNQIKSILLLVILAGLCLFSYQVVGIFGIAILTAILALCYGGLRILSRQSKEKIAFAIVTSATALVLFALVAIIFDIVSNGLPAITWEFLTEGPRNLGRSGGIFPAIIGTLYLVIGAIAIALPIGVGAAIYLNEYTLEGRLTRIIRAGNDLLNGTPSIVFGLFGFAFLVIFVGLGVSLLAGQITLTLMILPTIIRTSEEALKSVPDSLRHGSLALGATRWHTILRVVLPAAAPGILTGTILGIGRAAGETAPLLFTAVVFSKRYLPTSVFEPVMALPYHLFILATNVPGADTQKYGTALVLLVLVTGIYAVAILMRRHAQKTVRW